MPPQPTDTAAYIAALPEPQRATLEQLRTTIRVAAPGETYETSKGTIRFPASDALPYDLVTRLVQARVASLRAGGR
jgi:uncharacterized protein YdhG (YjbR/CyaY superfamily)